MVCCPAFGRTQFPISKRWRTAVMSKCVEHVLSLTSVAKQNLSCFFNA